MKLKLKVTAVAALLLTIGGLFAYAQNSDHAGHDGSHTHGSTNAAFNLPQEPGQGAFAAMTEIAAMMRADPRTDWSKANLQGLQDHLVDMDRLMTLTEASHETVANGLRFKIDLKLPENDAAARMVPAHAPVLAQETGWRSVVESEGDQLVWTVIGESDIAQIRALGFFGLMAVGDHHREHHWGMATGAMVH